MTNRTLQQRAHALQEEIARALEPGNKRRIKYTEALDILARVDGHRNRKAAQDSTGQDERHDDATETPAPPREVFDPSNETFSFDVPFEDGMGFLGAMTNGAPPDAVTGIRIACNDEDEAFWNEHPERGSLWLHATRTTIKGRDYDWLLSTQD